MSEIWLTETYTDTLILNKDQVEAMSQAQFVAYDAIKEKYNKQKIRNSLTGIATVALSLLFRNRAVGAIATGIQSMWSSLSTSDLYYRKGALYGGYKALKDIKLYWTSSILQIEVELGFIEDELVNTERVRYIMGNDYIIKRVRTEQGWLDM